MNSRKKLWIFLLFYLLILLGGCNASDDFLENEVTNTAANTDSEESETELVQASVAEEVLEDTSEEDEQWSKRIYVTADQLQGNILGYSLIRMPPDPLTNMYYERELPYLVDEAVMGNGIFVSEYMCETEVFLGNILKEVLAERGKISVENERYFTEYALQQLKETDWSLLDEDWEIDPYAYGRDYQLNTVFGENNYDFSYYFYPDREKTVTEETEEVNIYLSVNSSGQVYEIQTDIFTVPAEQAEIENYICMSGLFDELYQETMIQSGQVSNEKMIWDFEKHYRRFLYPDEVYEQENEGLLASGNAAASAEETGRIFIDILESRGTDIGQYEEIFSVYEDSGFWQFKNSDWGWLEENWTADEEYDCIFKDYIGYSGYVGFQYYFYPDYDALDTDVAKAVSIDCLVSIHYGEISHTSMKTFPMTREEYQRAKEIKREGRESTLVVEKGNILQGKEMVALPIPGRQLSFMPVSDFQADALSYDHSERKRAGEIWGFSDVAKVAGFLGDKFLGDIQNDTVEKGEIAKLCRNEDEMSAFFNAAEKFVESGWEADEQYDCYEILQNEVAGCMHLRYYFYPRRLSIKQKSGRVMVVDMYLSEQGIESMKLNEFRMEF